ncbi:MAG: iron ABC transporter permease [Gammaproteobacteria bacterium]|nr:iron ABC transporter permease [Gammaproteobacteria bacterium]MDE0282236.1 iron ABC transporter permease [Gammaproteobacteria bacterium]MDE0713367.1 iron ABC transporter permease [Gammaproteobacteria bacterium]MXY65998.1 iron ABC transporter permease [Gammaproteobacteria bacterium]MYG66543.1 iron ABC transporter permease [Gammaproteobacteria bacterium]
MRLAGVLTLGCAGLAGLLLVAVAVGSTPFSLAQILAAFTSSDTTSPVSRIVLDLRLPRALLAVIVGAGLGMVGAVLQTLTRNDLADPFLFGLSSGAAAGAVFVITVTGNFLGFWTLPLAAFAGGLIASLIVLSLFGRLSRQSASQMVLAGLAVSFLLLSLTNYLIFAGDQRAAHSVLFWTLGGLGLANWDVLPIALAGLAAIGILVLLAHRQLDALLAGDEAAETLGISVTRIRQVAFLVCAFATASFVALTGVIGFIGLMVPHLARGVAGPLHGSMMLTSAVIGACLLLSSDIAARTLLAPQELPIGVLTTSVGAVFVLVLVHRQK